MKQKKQIAKIYVTRCFEEARDNRCSYTFGEVVESMKEITLTKRLKKEVKSIKYIIKPLKEQFEEHEIDKNIELFNCTFTSKIKKIHTKELYIKEKKHEANRNRSIQRNKS